MSVTEYATTEEVQQLRSAVKALTVMSHAMMLELVKAGIAPVPEMTRYVSGLRKIVLDPEIDRDWEKCNATLDAAAQARLLD